MTRHCHLRKLWAFDDMVAMNGVEGWPHFAAVEKAIPCGKRNETKRRIKRTERTERTDKTGQSKGSESGNRNEGMASYCSVGAPAPERNGEGREEEYAVGVSGVLWLRSFMVSLQVAAFCLDLI